MWKYVTNNYCRITGQLNGFVQRLMIHSLVRLQSVTITLKKLMTSILDDLFMCHLEVLRLALGLPIVQFLHNFVKIDIEKLPFISTLMNTTMGIFLINRMKKILYVMLVLMMFLSTLQVCQEIRKVFNISKWQKKGILDAYLHILNSSCCRDTNILFLYKSVLSDMPFNFFLKSTGLLHLE